MKHIFIMNPAAGDGGKYKPYIDQIPAICQKAGADFLIHSTKAPGEATEFVRSFIAAHPGEALRFYAAGGDGTLCEVATGLAKTDAELGLIPIGTGNDFAKNFTHPEYFLDIERQLGGKSIVTDLVSFGDRYFINIFNVGFDCAVVTKVSQIKRKPLIPNNFAYTAGVVSTLVKKPTVHATVTFGDGEVIEKDVLLFLAANGCFYGGGYHAAPRALLNDGLLDVMLVKNVSRTKFVAMVGDYKAGKHLDKPYADDLFILRRTDSMHVSFSEPTDICADGEIVTVKDIDLQVHPKSVRFSLPEGMQYYPAPQKGE